MLSHHVVVERGARIAKFPKYRVRLRTEKIIPDGDEKEIPSSSSDTHALSDNVLSQEDNDISAAKYERNNSFGLT